MTLACHPTPLDLIGALRHVACVTGAECYLHEGRFHFPVDDDWSLALSPDSAGRVRVEASHRTRTVDIRWANVHDRSRLAELALGLREQVLVEG
jgi:hypothetical protein